MATGGSSRILKDYDGQTLCVKRFAYDVLYTTLSKFGFPKTYLEIKLDEKTNNYRPPNSMILVHYSVVCIALRMRDHWKLLFEYKQKNSEFNDMQEVEKYLLDIEVLLEFSMPDAFENTKRSLAFYSELILFLHYNKLDVNFGKLLDTWCKVFNEKIAVNCDPDVLLETILRSEKALLDLSFVDSFIEKVAKPYGMENDVSRKFKDVYADEKEKAKVGKLTQEFRDTHLESKPHDPSSKAVKKSVLFSTIPESDSALSGSLSSRGQPIRPRIVFSPRLNMRGVEVVSKSINIISEKIPQGREDQDTVLPSGHREYFEKPSAMAAGERWRIPKGYEGQRYNIKRFVYDVLHITLSKCGLPKTHLQVKQDIKKNNYRHSEYVLTIYSAVICNSLSMRDKWKRMFEYKQKSYVLNDMQKVEKYLLNIEVLPEFAGEGELYKIWRSLAFYSELILFLNHNNLEVNFEKFLDIWNNYFNEKIAISQDSDVLLEALFITDRPVTCYVDFLDSFLQETAIPYGKIADVSKRFRDFSEEVENFYDELSNRGDDLTASLKSAPHSLPDLLPEVVEELESIPSEIVRNESVSPDNCPSSEPPEQSHNSPLPPHNMPDPPPEGEDSASIRSAII